MICKGLVFAVVVLQVVHCRSIPSTESSELSCSDNATCINEMAQKLIKGVRENRTVRMFDLFNIEPMESASEGRSNGGGLARFFNSHSFLFDFGRYGIRVARSARKDSSVVIDIEDNSAKYGEDRGHSKKVMQMFLPVMLGFKAASTMIVAIAAVALLTFKAFVASKLALIVTISMVVKKFMDSYGGGGSHMPMNPYMLSQYPIEFPSSAGAAHSGYSNMDTSAYASPQLYGSAGITPLQPSSQDISGQYSQNVAEIQSANATSKFVPTAAKRWDEIKKKPMYYNSHNDAYSGYQEYKK